MRVLYFTSFLILVVPTAFGTAVSLASEAQAQSLQDRLIQRQDQIQRQDDQRRRALERERRLQQMEPPKPEEDDPPEEEQQGDPDRCVNVKRIDLKGATLLAEVDVNRTKSGFEGRCLNVAEIDALLAAINGLYRDAGFVTSRAYLEQQDLSDGVLQITVLEGRVEKMRLGEDGPRDRSQVYFAFPMTEGDILNLRDIEQGLDQMNRLPSNNARMEIRPGVEPGTSEIVITNDRQKMFRASVGRDNSGLRSTGKLQNVVTASLDNILGINDGWSAYYSRNARDHGDDRRSESFSGNISVPFGYATFSYDGSYSYYSSLVEAGVQDFLTDGATYTHRINGSYLLHRDQVSKTRADASLTTKRTRNFVEDVLVEVNSRDLTIGRLSLAHSRRVFGAVINLEAGHERGLRILGPLKDPDDQDSNAPKAQFKKWTADASVFVPFDISKQSFSWQTTTSWQYTGDTLFGSERIGVGGQYTVRGFREDTLAGDVGGYIRNELAWNPPRSDLGFVTRVVDFITPYVAYDWGWIRPDRSEFRERGVLSSWSVGIRSSADFATFSLEYSKPLRSPSFLDEPDNEVSFSFSARF